MYHSIVARMARANFERVNAKDHEAVLRGCAPRIRHRFGGRHALGGERNDREALGLWFARLGRVMDGLTLEVGDVWVKGMPNDTTVVVRWSATATLADGSPYANRGVHIVRMRWGKVVDIDAHEDSQSVVDGLARQAASGLAEAAAPQILS